MHHLESYGWNSHIAAMLESGETLDQVARVVQEHKEAYLVHAAGPHGSDPRNIWAEISGKMRHHGAVREDFPAVGDWVILRGLEHVQKHDDSGPVQITRILPRRTVLSRRLEGKREGGGATGDQQILAVNVDIAFLGTSLNENFNPRRMERYLALARDAGPTVRPVILLTKADLCDDVSPYIEEVRRFAQDADVIAVSVVTGSGMDKVRAVLTPGTTAVILGSSGIGKSTLVNYLAEEDIQDMMEAREFDDKGRHCTTFRHLVRTPTGGLIIDTPGLRGLTLGEASDALSATFTDIEELASRCKFTDCRHESEPGCAIKQALDAGTLDTGRLEGYMRLQRELTALARRENRILDRKMKKIEKKRTVDNDKRERRKWGQR